MLHVALLHSIILPHGRLVMSDLRDLAESLGLERPRTLVATGNLVFDSAGRAVSELEAVLEDAYHERFGRDVDIIVRDAAHWRRTAAANPFGDGPEVMVRIQRRPLPAGTLERLETYRPAGDEMRLIDGDLWVRFAGPPSQSRLLGALTTQRLGIGTSRIWNTVRRLGEMLTEDAI